MPVYEYVCPMNSTAVEVEHSIRETVSTWGDLCRIANLSVGETPEDAPVERLLFPPGLSFPQGDSYLKNIGFTKLVKRDTGVYENVTATGNEKRFMQAGDASSVPDFSKKIRD